MLELPPLALYVHIPWCVRKCPYCDFNSHEAGDEPQQQEYVDALCRDLSREADRVIKRPLQSIYFGGGTPSLFTAEAYIKLLEFTAAHFQFCENIEITLEANPGTAEAQRFADYHEAGINRLSLGIQSFDDLQLQRLGRIHDSRQASEAIAMARAAGFENFNLDIMYGLPGQNVRAALDDVQTAISYDPNHLSWYQLTIEPNTVFYRRPPVLPKDKLVEEIETEGLQLLQENKLIRYEVSAYAQTEHVSLHNRNYWCFGDYIGIGAGAHGKLSLPEENKILRTRKVKQPDHYLSEQSTFDAEVSEVSVEQRTLEYLMNTLRLCQGFTRQQFEHGTGLTFDTIAKRVEYLLEQGLMEKTERSDDQFYAASGKGYRILNSLLEEFL